MFTYTRAMDSVLCVPLMIDAAIWCDYFSRCGITAHLVAAATAYLFKVPEGGTYTIYRCTYIELKFTFLNGLKR